MKVYNFAVKDIENKNVSLSEYEGKVLLIINGATGCGFTKQYDGLQSLYEKYNSRGFEILDFPSNQFLEQSPGTNEEIKGFCKLNFGVTFKQFSKIDVNGENEEKLYTYLKSALTEETTNDSSSQFYKKVRKYTPDLKDKDIRWNFTKFLIDKEGNVTARFSPTVTPEEIEQHILKLL